MIEKKTETKRKEEKIKREKDFAEMRTKNGGGNVSREKNERTRKLSQKRFRKKKKEKRMFSDKSNIKGSNM